MFRLPPTLAEIGLGVAISIPSTKLDQVVLRVKRSGAHPTLTTPPGFAVSRTRIQLTKPPRLAAESSPSLESEGSTRSAIGQALSLPKHKRVQAKA